MRKTSYAITFLLVAVALFLVRFCADSGAQCPALMLTATTLSRMSSLSSALTGSPCPSLALTPKPASDTHHPHRLIVKGSDTIHTRITVRYGLTERCERTIIEIPGPSTGGKIAYTDYQCRPFPSSVTDRCEKGNRGFCTAWSSAGYLAELSVTFGAAALLSLIFGVSTHSRRRRIWKAVAVLVTAHGAFLLVWLEDCGMMLIWAGVVLTAAFVMAAWAIITDLWRTSTFWEFDHARPSFSYYVSLVSWIFSYAIVGGVIYTGVAADKGHRWAAGNRAYRIIEDRE
ncbi:hypothetical protein EVG20_g6777 [Dentipellis fragilis]|uniref:MARVEL domain-containing protein n=1 Tax=Dentipellis fragilis TaxID=205917 RepID=A0A4Y9YIN3_9AGAM|nr:hypothetical protein EVG20_g6777 [Dentipellis fragilis]